MAKPQKVRIPTRIDDMEELACHAVAALASALHDGDRSHVAGSWKEETPGNQYNHLQAHLRKLQNGISVEPETDDDHLDHLICRAVIIRALNHQS